MYQISLRTARKISGLSEKYLAEICGISPEEYVQIEDNTGLLTVELFNKIRMVMNIKIDKLYIGYESDFINDIKLEFFTPLLPHYFDNKYPQMVTMQKQKTG